MVSHTQFCNLLAEMSRVLTSRASGCSPKTSGKIHLAHTHDEAGRKYDTGQKRNGPVEFGAGLFGQAGQFKISQAGRTVAEGKGRTDILSFGPAA